MGPGGMIRCGQVQDSENGERGSCIGAEESEWWWWWWLLGVVEDLGARESGGRLLRLLASLRRNRDSLCYFGLEL